MKENNNIKNITGTPVTGKNFLGRAKEVQKGWSMIEEGKSPVLRNETPKIIFFLTNEWSYHKVPADCCPF